MKPLGFLLLLPLALATPAFSGDLQGVVQVVAWGDTIGTSYGCGLTSSGIVKCWSYDQAIGLIEVFAVIP
jgi:hypothetical protein